MPKNSLLRNCQIDISSKHGRTRLHMNEKEYYDYYKECISIEDEELENEEVDI